MIPGLLLYLDDLHTFDGLLSDSDLGMVIRAVATYIETGDEAEGLSPVAMVCYRIIKGKVDREISKYAKQAENGAKGGRPKTHQNPTKPNETQIESGFSEQNPNNQKEKETVTEKEKENINTTTTAARVREETPFGVIPIDPLIVKVQRELNGLTDTHYDLLAQYRQELGDELVSFAIDQSVAQGVRKWAYVERILNNWQQEGIRTVGDAKSADEAYRAKCRGAPKTVHAQQFTQRQYSDSELNGEVSPLFAEALKKVSGT